MKCNLKHEDQQSKDLHAFQKILKTNLAWRKKILNNLIDRRGLSISELDDIIEIGRKHLEEIGF